MANTKVTTRVIADDAITSDKLASGLTLGGNTVMSGTLTTAGDVKVAESNHAKVISNSVGDYFPSLEIQRTSGSSKTDYHWLLQLGSSGFLNFVDNTNNYYPAIFKNNGDVALANDTSASNPVLLLDQSAGEGTFSGTVYATTFTGALSGTIASATTATTQSASDNSTKVATTAFVGTAVSNLVDSSPSALNTLNELAAALGDDANFSTTVTNSIATKAAISGQLFTGNVSIRGDGNLEVGGYAGGTDYGLLLTPADSSNHYHLYTDTGGHLAFGAHGTIGSGEKMRLKSDGQLLLGLTASDVGYSTNAFELGGNIRFRGGNFGIKANDGSHEHHLVRSVASNNVYLAHDRIQVGAATGFVKITGGSGTGLQVDGPIKTDSYILFDYDGDMTGSNYYSIAETSSDKLRIARNFSSTDCIELDSSGNVAIQGGTLGVAGTITGTTLVSNDGNINGAPISAFKRTDQVSGTADSGVWRSTSSYVYDATNGTRHYWIKAFTMPVSNVRGVLEYQTKTDENYPQYSQGTIAFSSFNGGASFSVQHDQSTAEGVEVTCRLDTSRALWLQFGATWASNSRWRIFQFGTAVTEETSWTVGSNKLDPVTTSVPPNSSGDIDAGKNIRATSSSVTGGIPSYVLYKKGNVQADKAIVDTDLVFNGAVPIEFRAKGTGTYNKTVIYDGQNNTANNVFSGLTVEMARLTDSSSAVTRNFTISDRGAVKKYSFSQFGLSFNETTAAAANSLDDYEEGNFAPVLACSGGTGPSSQTGTGQYTKIGDVVHLTGQVAWSGSGSGGVNLRIIIPFNVISDARAGMAIGLNSGISYTSGHMLHLIPEINTNIIYFVSSPSDGGSHVHLNFSNVKNTASSIFSFSGSFHTRD